VFSSLVGTGPSLVTGDRIARSCTEGAGPDATSDRTRHNGNRTLATVSDW